MEELQKQVETYRRFKDITHAWIDLAIEHSRLKMEIVKTARE